MNIPPVMTRASGAELPVEHDPRTCPACAEVASAEERASWVETLDNGAALVSRPRRYRKGKGSVVVSVRLDQDEWEQVSAAAERAHLYISQFVREAAVRMAKEAAS